MTLEQKHQQSAEVSPVSIVESTRSINCMTLFVFSTKTNGINFNLGFQRNIFFVLVPRSPKFGERGDSSGRAHTLRKRKLRIPPDYTLLCVGRQTFVWHGIYPARKPFASGVVRVEPVYSALLNEARHGGSGLTNNTGVRIHNTAGLYTPGPYVPLFARMSMDIAPPLSSEG